MKQLTSSYARGTGSYLGCLKSQNVCLPNVPGILTYHLTPSVHIVNARNEYL